MTSKVGWSVLTKLSIQKELKKSGFLSLYGDITNGNKLVTSEMKKLNRIAVPVTAIYNTRTKSWKVMPEVFSGEDVMKWIRASR